MQATTSGVTHKNNVILQKDLVESFLKDQKSKFKKFNRSNNVLYNAKTTITDPALNYLNMIPENSVEESLKNIILREYYTCESLFPYLGDYLLYRLFNSSKVRCSQAFVFEKKHQEKFTSSLHNNITVKIADWFFDNISLNRSINVESYKGNSLSVESLNEFVFDIDYDYDFYKNKKIGEIKHYRFALINGIIESVGEIHHLLHNANKTKECFVIFCMGMSEEVKQTIITNNSLGKTRVYPVCVNVNDTSSLNILNDLAAIHDSSIISSDLGQTISQEIRKELPIGEKISFLKNQLSLIPVANHDIIESHRKFLKNRIDEAETKIDVRVDVLKKRLKMFTGNRINFYIPEYCLQSKSSAREIDYYFRFISVLNKSLKIAKLDDRKFYIPSDYINIVETKKNSLLEKFSNIKVVIA